MLAPCLEYKYVYYSLLLLVFKLVFFTHQKNNYIWLVVSTPLKILVSWDQLGLYMEK